jgi:hypothetical protein
MYSACKMQCPSQEGHVHIFFYWLVVNTIDMFISPTIDEFVSATAAKLWRLQEFTDPPATHNCQRNCRTDKAIP